MLSALLAVLIIGAIVVVSELLWKRIKVHPELARKFVHITCGVFISFFALLGKLQLDSDPKRRFRAGESVKP